jgi:hypothetical protein
MPTLRIVSDCALASETHDTQRGSCGCILDVPSYGPFLGETLVCIVACRDCGTATVIECEVLRQEEGAHHSVRACGTLCLEDACACEGGCFFHLNAQMEEDAAECLVTHRVCVFLRASIHGL